MLRPLTTLAVALLAALALIAVPTAATAAPVDIASAPPLKWGFKESWRAYTGQPTLTVSDGASVVGDVGQAQHQLAWPFVSGSYHAETGTTVLRYSGTAHWAKYYYPDNPLLAPIPPGYDGSLDIYLLDVTLSDPTVTIGPDGATVSARASGRSTVDWRVRDYGRLDLAELDVAGLTPTIAGDTTTWPAIPATSTADVPTVFTNNYRQGLAIDPVAFSYTGPGGAPDLTEDFDAPGTTPLTLAADGLSATSPFYSMLSVDLARKVGYFRTMSTTTLNEWTYHAYDLETLQPVGDPLVVTDTDGYGTQVVLDADTGRLYLRRPADGAGLSRWIRYDRASGHLETGTLAAPATLGAAGGLVWDTAGHRAWEVVRVVPDGVDGADYDHHVWTLYTYSYDLAADAFTRKAYTLPSLPPALNRSGYKRGGTVASDGSFVVLGDRQLVSPSGAVPTPTTVPGAYRVVLDEIASTATATAIPGFTVPNDSAGVPDGALAGPDGRVVLTHLHRAAIRPGWVREIDVDAPGGPTAGAEFQLAGFDGWSSGAVDPEDGTLWLGGAASKRIVAVRDGRVVNDQVVAKRHPSGGFVAVGPGHVVYAQTNDGSGGGAGANGVYGVGRFERIGVSPDVAAGAPGDAAVTLAVDEVSEDVTLTAPAVEGTPAPSRKWQVKAPGGTRFKDVAGADGAALTVAAKRGDDGAQYRVLYANDAGRAVSETATLSVKYVPSVTFDPVSLTVVAGKPATFQVLVDGNPAPGVTWQRQVGGFWQDIDPSDDDNVVVDNDTLTIVKTDTDQDGARFRARVGNSVASTFTKAAKLTVTSATVTPRTLIGVRFDWGISDEIQALAPNGQANFLSAETSDGTEATYKANANGVRILQVSTSGDETAATWATRGAHTTSGGRQLVRLTDGAGSIAADGTTTVAWPGTFSINFYGGLVPFTIKNVRLIVAPDGTGTLMGDLSGYGASQAHPEDRTPVATVADVTIATFTGARVDADGATTSIVPAYAGVTADLPVGSTQQDRTTLGWGAWPQPFIDFQVKTGLAPYWYSSGGIADARKAPSPFTVTVTGAADPTGPVAPEPGGQPAPPQDQGASALVLPPKPRPAKPGWITIRATKQRVAKRTRTATLATLSCPKSAATCTVTVPKTVRITIGGKAYTATVLAAKPIKAGRAWTLRVRLTVAALKRLKGRTAIVRIKATIATGATQVTKTVAARITS